MNKCMAVLLILVCVVATGCGNKGDTSTGGASADLSRSENTITNDRGGLIYVVYDEKVFVDDVARVKYAVRNSAGEDQPGTLHWGDNSSSRVRGNGLLKHIYRTPGTYTIAIQPDDEKKLVVASVIVEIKQKSLPIFSPGGVNLVPDGRVTIPNCEIIDVAFMPASGTVSKQNSALRAVIKIVVDPDLGDGVIGVGLGNSGLGGLRLIGRISNDENDSIFVDPSPNAILVARGEGQGILSFDLRASGFESIARPGGYSIFQVGLILAGNTMGANCGKRFPVNILLVP